MSQPFKDRLEETVAFGSSDLGERLFTTLAMLPPEGELEDAVWALVSTFSEGLEEILVGVCVPDVGGEQLIVRHAPRPSRPRVTDAARLFPEVEHEQVFAIPFEEGATLHIGCDDAVDSALRRASEQLALAVGTVVRRARHSQGLAQKAAEAERLRDQAVQSDKLAGLGRMAASIVHELNNPLTSIVAYADFLRQKWDHGQVDPSDRERLGRISEAAGRVLSFARDLVAYSRPSSANASPLSIHDVIERAIVFCDHTLNEQEVTIERHYGELRAIVGLQGPLTQVFVNLITNACQAMSGRKGRLVIETVELPAEGVITIRLSDNGHGFQQDQADRLFEPYFTTRTDGGGNGLGLNIVQTIVASHGGSVSAVQNDGDGATFTVTLPMKS